jgi:hypothetical protein
MKDFEEWFEVYKKTIRSLQKQKGSSQTTLLGKHKEELLAAEKEKSKLINGYSKDKFISELGIKIRATESKIRKAEKYAKIFEDIEFSSILSLLEKHSAFAGASVDADGSLNLYTKNLKYGSKSLGRYRFVLENNDHSAFWIFNCDYGQPGYPYEHWAVNNFKPCLGQYQDEFIRRRYIWAIRNDGSISYQLRRCSCLYEET